jgi:hypothetical protein
LLCQSTNFVIVPNTLIVHSRPNFTIMDHSRLQNEWWILVKSFLHVRESLGGICMHILKKMLLLGE